MIDHTYRAWKRSFETPEDLFEKMMEYLTHIKNQNAPRLAVYDLNTGRQYETVEEAMADGLEMDDIQREIIPVPAEEKIRPTMYGFAAFCNMGSKTLWHYAKKGEEFAEVVEWFKNILQADLEQILINPMTRNTNGPKFIAINNYGWRDKSEVEHTGAQPVTFVNDLTEV